MNEPPLDELIWEDDVPPSACPRHNVAGLLAGLAVIVAMFALLAIGIDAVFRKAWDEWPVDGFFKHDDPSQLLKTAESVPVPTGLEVRSRDTFHGSGDASSDASIDYADPDTRRDLCMLLDDALTSAGWRSDAFGSGLQLTPPTPPKPAGAQISVSCYPGQITVEVDGQ